MQSAGGRPVPEFLANCEEACVKDIFESPTVWSPRRDAQNLSVSLIDGSLEIEQDGFVAVKVPVKFAEIACCHMSELPSCGTGFTESSLLAVMPEGTPGSTEEAQYRRPVWILLVHADVMKMIESMTAAGAIRTDLFDVYAIGKFVLGKGSFAQVHFAYPRGQQHEQGQEKDNQNTQEIVAKTFIPRSSGQAQHAKDEAAALLAIGSHPNIVSFHGIFATSSDTGKQWALLLGYCAAGNLLHCLQTSGVFKISPAKHLAGSMLSALAHVHSRGYMHRDVKPENVLIDTTGRFILGDCGAAVQVFQGRLYQMCGTPGYLAPEVLNGGHYNELIDLFSLGAMMHLCICGRRLFPGQSSKDFFKCNVEGRIDLNLHASKYLSAAGLEFLSRLLAREPSTRPSAQDALGQEWFNEDNEEKAVKVSSMREMSKISSGDDDFYRERCYFSQCDRNQHIRYDRARNSEPGGSPKSSKSSVMSSFKGILRRPGRGRGSTLTKIVPITPEENSFQGPDSAPRGSSHKAHASQNNVFGRTFKALAWMRGARQPQSHVPQKDLLE